MPPPRSIAGQASAEYVALLAVVAAIVAGAAAVGSPPPLALKLTAAVRHGICRVAGGVCTSGEARAAGLAPCLLQASMEAIANALKHAGESQVAVSAKRGTAALRVEVRDDGRGGADVDAGSGLRRLGDRVAAIGGQLSVRSPAGHGTRVVAELPVRRER